MKFKNIYIFVIFLNQAQFSLLVILYRPILAPADRQIIHQAALLFNLSVQTGSQLLTVNVAEGRGNANCSNWNFMSNVCEPWMHAQQPTTSVC